jgi:hypothetical protein
VSRDPVLEPLGVICNAENEKCRGMELQTFMTGGTASAWCRCLVLGAWLLLQFFHRYT